MSTSGGGSLMDLFVEIRAENPKLAADLEAAQAKILKSGEETQAKLRAMMLRQQLEMKSMGNPGTAKYDNQTAEQRARYEDLAAGAVYIAVEMTKAQNAVDRKMASIQKYAEKVAAATVNVKAFAAAEANAAAVQEKAASTSGNGTASKTEKEELAAAKKRALGFVLISQAVEDMQYGFNAVVNNIPGIVMSLGFGAGLAGGLSIAGVAVNQLINNWSKLKDALGLSSTLTEAERMNKLAEATSRTAEETLKLAKYKEREATAAAMAGSKTKAEEAQAEGVKKAFGEAGYGAVKKGLTESARDMLTSTDADARNAKDAADYHEKNFAKPGTIRSKANMDRLVELRKKENDAVDAAAVKMMAEAALTPDGLKKMMNAVSKNPGAFPKGLGGSLSGLSGEDLKLAKEMADEAKLAEDNLKITRENNRDRDAMIRGKADSAAGMIGDSMIGDLYRSADNDLLVARMSAELLRTGKETSRENADAVAKAVVEKKAGEFDKSAQEMVLKGDASDIKEAKRLLFLKQEVTDAEKKKADAAKLIDDFKPKVSDIGSYLNSLQTNIAGDPRLKVAEDALRVAKDQLKTAIESKEKLDKLAPTEVVWK